MGTMRKEIAEKGSYQKLFERYHECITEIQESTELLNESIQQKDSDLQSMIEGDLDRLRGTDEDYGVIEEIQEDIVDQILPMSDADKRNSCTLEIM